MQVMLEETVERTSSWPQPSPTLKDPLRSTSWPERKHTNRFTTARSRPHLLLPTAPLTHDLVFPMMTHTAQNTMSPSTLHVLSRYHKCWPPPAPNHQLCAERATFLAHFPESWILSVLLSVLFISWGNFSDIFKHCVNYVVFVKVAQRTWNQKKKRVYTFDVVALVRRYFREPKTLIKNL